ncbi:hypothetical protein KC343_g1539 [Hortaea werneckii]|nr:hypothetical protein KC317_g1792 [Hortaea werneckii]KAI7635944.1 hypothetical protein KC343_g1539 [Hortaea werneckii]
MRSRIRTVLTSYSGTILQAAAHDYGTFIVGRVVGGTGNGMVTSTIPTWQSETSKPERRGRMVEISAAVNIFGVMSAYWIDYALYFVPTGARLAGKDPGSEEVDIELNNIKEALEVQSQGGFQLKELLTNGPSQNLRRTLLGIMAQFFQQICGINLITYYATYVFENSLGFGPDRSRLLCACNGTEYFIPALIAIPLIERVGRRKLMIAGAFGMMASMAILAGASSTATINRFNAPVLDTSFGVVATVFLFGFNTCFAIGWLGMTWLYPAEITNLRIRIQANALSTCSN